MTERVPGMLDAVAESIEGRERHEKAMNEILEDLRGQGYFHEGESFALVFPAEGENKKWLARVDVKALYDPPVDEARKAKFPSADTLHDRLVAAGYAVEVHPGDFDADTMTAEYRLFEKVK